MDEKGFMIGRTNKQMLIIPVEHLQAGGDTLKALIDGSREWVTLVACICADGTAVAPALIFKGQSGSVNANWASEHVTGDEFFMTTSEKGWTNDELGMAWLTQVFIPHIKAKAPNARRTLLIVDGHSSHANFAFFKKCHEHGILVEILPPHSTHRLQPLDIGLFAPLSTNYTTKVTELCLNWEARIAMSKSLFFMTSPAAWKSTVTAHNIKGAF